MLAERAAATWEQFRLSGSYDCTVLHANLNELRSIPPAAQICPFTAFAVTPVRTLRYFPGVAQDLAHGPGSFARHHHFSTVVRIEMALRVTEGLVVQFAVMEQVPLLDKPIFEALLCCERFLMQSKRFSPIVGEVFERRCNYHALPLATL